MNTLALLYFLYLELGGVGQGKVSILALSRYMRVSKTKMKNDLVTWQDMGLINVYEKFGDGKYKRYLISLSVMGQQHLDENWDAAMIAYRKHVAETIALMKERTSGKYPPDRKLTKAQLKQVAAGERELF